MWFTNILLVVVGLVLAGQAMAVPKNPVLLEDGTLIAHPQASKELTRDQLLEKLNGIDPSLEGKISELVADLLYKTDDKENTKVLNDVTVAELIAQNEFQSLELGCTLESIGRRADVYKQTIPTKDSEGGYEMRNSEFAVNVYALRSLQMAVYYCMIGLKEVTSKGILTMSQLIPIGHAFNADTHFIKLNEEQAVSDVLTSKPSRLVKAIEKAVEKQREEEAKEREDARE